MFWAALGIAALSSIEGPAQEFMKTHPGVSGSLVSFVVVFLRCITYGKVSMRRKNPDSV